jgi:hypothetical protein
MAGGYRAGSAFIQVSPSLSDFQQEIRRQLKDELDTLGAEFPVKPKADPSQGGKDGEQYGGSFADAAKARIDAALKTLPDAKLGADASQVDRAIAEVRARLEELRDKRVNLELSEAEFLAGVRAAKAELDDLGRRSPTVEAKFNAAAASAELAAFDVEVRRLDGKTINVRTVVDTAASIGNMNLLLTAGLALGPALIPVAASITAAFGAVGTGALLGIGSLGTLALGFGGVTDAVKAMGAEQQKTGQTAAQAYAQQLSSANSVLSAQDSLTSATESLGRAQAQVGIAAETATRNVTAALDRQRQAEQSLITAQRSALRAQQDLNQARRDAQRALEDLAFQSQDNALAQQRAQLDLQQAQFQLNQIDPTLGGGNQQQEAQLAVDEARQRLLELQAQGRRLAEDKAAADKAGVDGSRQVTAAQDALVAANERVQQAQDQVRASADAVTQAQVDGARQVDQAKQAVIAATRQAEAAERGVTAALAQQAAEADKTTASQSKLAAAMAKLSPEGQQFARFIESDLIPKYRQLQATAQAGLLPGVESGIRAAMPQFGLLDSIVGELARGLGDLADRAGHALNDPFWVNFFGFIRDEAGPSTKTFGDILGNLATGAAGLVQAFKPVWDDMGAGLKGLSEKFANFGKDAAAGKSDSFNGFLQYVRDTWPDVKELFVQLKDLVVNLAKAFGGRGASTLSLVVDVLKWINSLDPGTLRLLIDLFIAWKTFQIAAGTLKGLKDAYDTIKGIGDILGGIRKGGGIGGALGTGSGSVVGPSTAAILGGGAAAAGGQVGGGLNAQSQTEQLQQYNAAHPLPPGVVRPEEYKAGGFGGIDLSGVVSAFQSARTKIAAILTGVNADTTAKLGQFRTTVSTFNVDAANQMKAPWNDAPAYFARTWSGANLSTVKGFGDLKTTVGAGSTDTSNIVQGHLGHGGLADWMIGNWNAINTAASTGWGGIHGTVATQSGQTRDETTGNINQLATNTTGSFQWAKDTIGKIWSGLGAVVKPPVNFLIDPIYDTGIRGIWNFIAGTFGMPQLPYVHPLAEGGVLPGYAPGKDTIPAVLSAGEGVLVPEAVRGLGADFVHQANRYFSGGRANPTAGPMFAGGGIVGNIVGALRSGWDWVTDLVSDPVGTVRRLFSGVTDLAGGVPGVGALRDALAGIPGRVVDAVIAKAKSWAAEIASAGGALLGPLGAGQVFNAGQVIHAAQAKGIPHPGAVIGIMTGLQESGLRVLANSNVPASLSLPHEGVGHDHDSVGIFQQRPSWGPLPVLMNPMGSASLFFNKLGRGPYGDYGAEAQRVQVSAFPGAYSKWRGQAESLVGGAGYALGGRVPGSGVADSALLWATPGERVLTTRENLAFEHLVDAISSNRSVAPVPLTTSRAPLGGRPGQDMALMAHMVDSAAQRAVATLDGAKFEIADNGRGGIASITRRQQAQRGRRG